MKINGHYVAPLQDEAPVSVIDLHWMGDYYGWCVAAYDAAGNMCGDYEPSYHELKSDAKSEAHRQAAYYQCRMIWHTKSGKAMLPADQYIKKN